MIVRVLNILALIAAAAWLGASPDWRSGLAVITAFTTLFVIERRDQGRLKSTDTLITVFAHQGEATHSLIDLISSTGPGIARIVGISSSKRHDLLDHLCKRGWHVQLLMQHPDAAMNEELKRNIEAFATEALATTFRGYDRVEVRFYKFPCLFRGSDLQGIGTCLGWYTLSAGPFGLFGHENPVVFTRSGTSENVIFLELFDQHFSYLWNHKSTMTKSMMLRSTGSHSV